MGEEASQNQLTCPNCQNSEAEKILGYEIPEVYDGTLFWVCLACGGAWPRHFGEGHPRSERSRRYAEWYNNRSARRVP